MTGEQPTDLRPSGSPANVGVSVQSSVGSRLGRWWAAMLDHPVRAAFLVSVAIRSLVALVVNRTSDQYLIPDEGSLLQYARAIERGIHPEEVGPGYGESYVDATASYIWQVVGLFELFGTHRLVAQVPSVVWGSATAAVVTAIALVRLRRSTALVAGLVVAVFPSQVLWSALVMRESTIWFLLACSGLLVARTAHERRFVRLGLVVLFQAVVFVLLSRLRLQTAFVCLLGFAAAFVLVGRPRKVRAAWALLLLLVVPWMSGLGPFGSDFVNGALSRLGYTRVNMGRWADSAFDYDDEMIDIHISGKLGSAGKALAEGQTVGAVIEAGEMVRHATHLTDQVTTLDVSERAMSAAEAAARAEEAAARALEQARLAKEAGTVAADRAGEAAAAAAAAARQASIAAAEAAEMVEVVRNVARLASEALAGASRLIEEAELEASGAGGAWSLIEERDRQIEPIETSLGLLHEGLYNTMVRPWPWQAQRSSTLLAASVETPLWLAVYLLAGYGLWRHRRDIVLIAYPTLIVLGIAISGAVSHGNLGTAFRHRGQVAFGLVLLAVAGGQALVDRRRGSTGDDH